MQLSGHQRSLSYIVKKLLGCRRKACPFVQVPSFGILSNGTRYIFYKYTPADRRLVHHAVSARLKHCISATEASKEVQDIICHLVAIIKQQMQDMDSFQEIQEKKRRIG